MLSKTVKSDALTLDDVIDKLLIRLHKEDPATETYAHIADQLVKLYKLKEIDSKKRVSPDMLASVGANVFGIVAILCGERFGYLVTSKAFNILKKAGS